MKYIMTFVILFHSMANGYAMIGFAIPGSTSLAYDSNGLCIKYTGESSECNPSERFFMEYLFALEQYNKGEVYTHVRY